MKKFKKPMPKVRRRHIEDIPFYRFSYKADDLPLDPAKDFILEEISENLRSFMFKFYSNLKL